MKIKLARVEPLIAALKKLDEPIVLTSESNADGKMETKRIKMIHFDAVTRIKLGRNLRKLKVHAEDIQAAREKGFRDYAVPSESNPEKLVLSGDNNKKFQVEMNNLLSSEVDVDLEQIEADDLHLKDNPIPVEVLGELWDTIFIGDIK